MGFSIKYHINGSEINLQSENDYCKWFDTFDNCRINIPTIDTVSLYQRFPVDKTNIETNLIEILMYMSERKITLEDNAAFKMICVLMPYIFDLTDKKVDILFLITDMFMDHKQKKIIKRMIKKPFSKKKIVDEEYFIFTLIALSPEFIDCDLKEFKCFCRAGLKKFTSNSK